MFKPEDVIEYPKCPTCDNDIVTFSYDAVLETRCDMEPLWEGGPLVSVPGTERSFAVPGLGYTAVPCGHAFNPAGMTWVTRSPAEA
jgi:hypothetical protein